jgi:hypothetical protein
MSRVKQASKRIRSSKAIPVTAISVKAVPVLGAAGLSLALAGGASAATEAPAAAVPAQSSAAGHEITLREEEVADVSLATFYVFDKENAGPFRPGIRLAMGVGGCGGCAGCSGCGCWTGTYYTSPAFGDDAYPPPGRPFHRYAHAPRHVPKKP